MFDRLGRDKENSNRVSRGGHSRPKTACRIQIEPLEGRTLLTASLAPIPSVTVEATQGIRFL